MINDTRNTIEKWVIASEIEKEKDNRKYFCLIPNMINEDGLSVHAFRLYCYIKRRTGEYGKCFESSKKIAKACCMSDGSVSKAKKELKSRGLIEIRKYSRGHGEFPGDEIRIVDIWEENYKFYEAKYKNEKKQQSEEVIKPKEIEDQFHGDIEGVNNSATCSPDDSDAITTRSGPNQEMNRTVAPDDTKKNPLRRTKIQEGGLYEESNSILELPPNYNTPPTSYFKDTRIGLIFKAITGRYPPKALHERIINLFGEDGEKCDVNRLELMFQEWVARGYNPINYSGWVFDWYCNYDVAPEKISELEAREYYSLEMIEDAKRLASEHGGGWNYALAILEGWDVEDE